MRALNTLCALVAVGMAGLTTSHAQPTNQVPFGVSAAAAPFPSPPYDGIMEGRQGFRDDDDNETVTKFSHPSLPAHSLRLHRLPSTLCESNPHTRSWAGYLDVDLDKLWEPHANETQHEKDRWAKHPRGVSEHFYFVFFEARNKPTKPFEGKETDVILWLNGGPGCSSFTGLLMENGPCSIKKGKDGVVYTEPNPYSWNNNASVLYLDQPAGVGFSYTAWTNGTKNELEKPPPARVWDTTAAAKDTSAFLHLLALHAEHQGALEGKGSPFAPRAHIGKKPRLHIAGESYGGRYVPLLAHQILKDNAEAKAHPERGLKPLPLNSILIGNGWSSPIHQYPAYVSYACNNPLHLDRGPFYNESQCEQARIDLPTCLALTKKCNSPKPDDDTHYDALACRMATEYCEKKLADPWDKTGRSPYDWRHKGEYEEDAWITTFLNAPKTKKAFGVDKLYGDHHNGTFTGCSDAVFSHFGKSGDGARDSTWAVREALEADIRVGIYHGDADFICNYQGGERWTYDLEWSGAEKWRKIPSEVWYAHPYDEDRKPVGVFRSDGVLNYITVWNAGHFVPHDQPDTALALINFWMYDGYPGGERA